MKECSLPNCGRYIDEARSSHIRMSEADGSYRYFCRQQCWQAYWNGLAKPEQRKRPAQALAGLLRLRWRTAS